MARQIIVDLVGNDKLSTSLKSAQNNLSKFGNKANQFGSMMTRRVTLPILGGAAAAIKFGSDLRESQDAAIAVFGKSSGAIQKWARNLNSAFGLTEKDALDMATQLRAVTQNSKLTNDQMLTLAERAADVGALFNVSAKEVGERFRSALTGSGEVLERFGINTKVTGQGMTEFAKSIGKSVTELTEAEKIQGVYNIIMDQSRKAAGNAADTQESFAGQMRIAKTDAANLTAEIGTQLIPIGLSLIKNVRGITRWFGNLTEAQQAMIIKVALVVAAIGPTSRLVGSIANLLVLMAGPAGLVFAIAAIGVAAFALSRDISIFGADFMIKWNNIRIDFINILNDMKGALDRFFEAAGRVIPGAGLLSTGRRFDVPRRLSRSSGNLPGLPVGPPTQARQTGGMVPGVPGQPVPIIAHGGEMVLRSSQARNGGGAPMIINLNLDGRQVASVIVDPIRRQVFDVQRRNVTSGIR